MAIALRYGMSPVKAAAVWEEFPAMDYRTCKRYVATLRRAVEAEMRRRVSAGEDDA
jgi:hypothetical protein